MRTTFTSLVLVAMIAVAAQVRAQTGIAPYGYHGGWGYPRHASTLEEGIQRGYADVMRSYGIANLYHSEAAKNYQQAYRDYLDNRLRATQVYFEMRRYNEEARRAERPTRLSTAQYAEIARKLAPARLSANELDPFTGNINWPETLQRSEYEAMRGQIDTLFQMRAKGVVLTNGELAEASDRLLATLKADIRAFRQTDYIQARNFVASLSYESRRPKA